MVLDLPPQKSPGDDLFASEINQMTDALRDTAQRIQFTVDNLAQGGPKVLFDEAATLAYGVNSSSSDIEFLAPVGIEANAYANQFDKVPPARVYELRVPEARHGGRFGIAAQPIPRNKGGWFWIEGACPCLLIRIGGFKFPRFADILVGQQALIAFHPGAAEILWEAEKDTNGVAWEGLETKHLAIVDLKGHPYGVSRYQMSTGTGKLGKPLAVNLVDASGMQDNVLKLRTPALDSMTSLYVGMAGDASGSDEGSCFPPIGTFMARVDQAVTVGDYVGTKASQENFFKDFPGFRVHAYLGQDPNGNFWAILERPGRDYRLCALKQDINADATGNVIMVNRAYTEIGAQFAAKNVGPSDAEDGNKVMVGLEVGDLPFFAF